MDLKNIHQQFLIFAEQFKHEPAYYDYCLYLEKGLRKEALKIINNFVADLQQRDFEQQKTFIETILTAYDKYEGYPYNIMPHPLFQLIFGLIKDWCDRDLVDERFFFWYGKHKYEFQYIELALAKAPDFEKAKVAIVEHKLYPLYYATHHLPDYYIDDGYENDDLARCNELKQDILSLKEESQQDKYMKELAFYQTLIENYIEWKKSGHTDFRQWGEAHNKLVDSGVIAIYYEK